jgi:hypothetical protein
MSPSKGHGFKLLSEIANRYVRHRSWRLARWAARMPKWEQAMKLRAFVALLGAVGASCAMAQTPPHPLSGTWIAVDDGFPRLVAAGFLVPTEEVLYVSADGRAESRLMNISGFDTHFMCMDGWGCSDMLSVRTAQAQLTGDALTFATRASAPEAAAITKDTQNRAAGLTLIAMSPKWAVTFTPGSPRVRFEADGVTRHFTRIEPERLRKLRSAFSAPGIPYSAHWRCFLSNATADDPAFESVGGPRKKPGAWFEDYLMAAAHFHQLTILTGAPVRDDDMSRSDPTWAKSATMKVTNSLLDAHTPYPSTLNERLKYRGALLAISGMVHFGNEKEAFEAARMIDPGFTGNMGVTPSGIAALKKVMSDNARQDPDVRETFCLDLKDAPPPRAPYDSFRGRAPN